MDIRTVVEKIIAFVTLEPEPTEEVEVAARQAAAGDGDWAQWLSDVANGRAVVATLALVLELRTENQRHRVHGGTTGIWIELNAHMPLIEREIQAAASIALAGATDFLAKRASIHLDPGELADMYVEVDVSDGIRKRVAALPDTSGAGDLIVTRSTIAYRQLGS